MIVFLQPAPHTHCGSVKLSVIFLLSFILPSLLLYGVITYTRSEADLSSPDKAQEVKKAFPIRDSGDYIRIQDAAGIEPVGDKDFLLAISLKFLNPPESSQKTFLLQKYDRDSPEGQGYSIAFIRDTDGIHPLVYWRNSEGQGRWFRFAALEIVEKEWFCLVLSFLQGEMLGLHVVRTAGTPVVLGGYRFDAPVYPESDADMFIGSIRSGVPLRARLGGMFVLHKRKLQQALPEMLSTLNVEPVSGKLSLSSDVAPVFFAEGFRVRNEVFSGSEYVTRFRKGRLLADNEE